jgi:hypothetical protein
MNWKKSDEPPTGFSAYKAHDEQKPGHTYVIQKKRTGASGWRLAHRTTDQQPLRIIYLATTLAECKAYAEHYREAQ